MTDESLEQIWNWNFPALKEEALPYLAAGWDLSTVAEAVGVNVSTLRGWLRDPEYQAAVRTLRLKHLDLLWRGIEGLSHKVLSNIREALESDDPKIRWDATKWAAGVMGVSELLRTAQVRAEFRIEGRATEETIRRFLIPALKSETDEA